MEPRGSFRASAGSPSRWSSSACGVRWAPIWGSVLFGALMILYLRLVIAFIPTQLYKILPYVVTVIVLIISSMRNNKEKQPPASLGLNYFREER